jgi:hypothetical protein
MDQHFRFLGYQVKDKVTGFTGVGTSLCFDLYGCVQTAVAPSSNKDGKLEDGRWFDNVRLERVSEDRVLPLPVFAVNVNDKVKQHNGPSDKPGYTSLPTR